ncbi:cadmium resistance transporter [Sinomonas sp.]|uniref:cadmium resistance transporter n=1 Tax=Sinomonas sp. TaxID=1914986 RepID=UPI002FE057B0
MLVFSEAVGAFAATNADDFVLLVVLFTAFVRGPEAARRIWVGQFVGIGALTAVSLAIARSLEGVPLVWVGLLGLAPLAIGLYALLKPKGRASERTSTRFGSTVTSVALMTVANGADNITAYVPLFRVMTTSASLATIAVFAVMTALWCLAACWISSRPVAVHLTRRIAPHVVPFLYILIGLVILGRSALESLS